jgi:hypothetical protein
MDLVYKDNLDNCITKSVYSIRSILQGHQSKHKRQKLEQALPVIYGLLQDYSTPKLGTKIRILLDSGASQSIVHEKLVSKSTVILQHSPTTWCTVAGQFITKYATNVVFKLPSLHERRVVETKMHVSSQLNTYDMIIGRDLLQELGIVLNFNEQSIMWDYATVPMMNYRSDNTDSLDNFDTDSRPVAEATDRMKRILEAKYEAADLDAVVSECKNLNEQEQKQLLSMLNQYKSLFDGTLGHWKNEKYDIHLKQDAKPYHARPYPVPKAYEATLKMEVERL